MGRTIEITQGYDAVVIGGGPAGATAAACLAAAGHLVLLAERHRFPRFHIGESLLPYTVGMFRKLSFAERMAAGGFPVKTGAEFSAASGGYFRFDFSQQGEGRDLTTYQVERADFDAALLSHAAECGAQVHHQLRVESVEWEGDRAVGVRYKSPAGRGRVAAKQILNASGRAGLITKQSLRSRRIVSNLRNAAVFTHFSGVDEATNPGVKGDIQIGVHDDGWVWAIPIRADKLSVGSVVRSDVLQGSSTVADSFWRYVNQMPRIRQRLADTRLCGELRVETDFSYYSDLVAGPGFFVLGDAGCFVDPIFSGGVHLAMATGKMAAERASDILDGRVHEPDATSWYSRFYKTGYDCYFRLALAFYDNKMEQLSLSGQIPRQWEVRLLAGDFWSAENEYANLLRSISEYAVFQPFKPLYSCPVYPAENG